MNSCLMNELSCKMNSSHMDELSCKMNICLLNELSCKMNSCLMNELSCKMNSCLMNELSCRMNSCLMNGPTMVLLKNIVYDWSEFVPKKRRISSNLGISSSFVQCSFTSTPIMEGGHLEGWGGEGQIW